MGESPLGYPILGVGRENACWDRGIHSAPENPASEAKRNEFRAPSAPLSVPCPAGLFLPWGGMAEPPPLPPPTATGILIGELSSLGAGFNPPADSRRIDEVEEDLGVSFPAGVREFYLRCDGITGDIEWFWDFFPLATLMERTVRRRTHPFFILEDGSRIPYADLVCFCDVLIDAPTYVFHGNPLDPRFGQFYADGCADGWMVAESFDDFVRVFVAEHGDILMGFGNTVTEGK